MSKFVAKENKMKEYVKNIWKNNITNTLHLYYKTTKNIDLQKHITYNGHNKK